MGTKKEAPEHDNELFDICIQLPQEFQIRKIHDPSDFKKMAQSILIELPNLSNAVRLVNR